MTPTKTYTKNCQRCGEEFQTYRNYRKPVTCDRRDCIEAEATEHNAAVMAARAQRASEPRRPRRARTTRPLYGDYAWVAVINGLDPATGRPAKR
jgi:hypothetical protein